MNKFTGCLNCNAKSKKPCFKLGNRESTTKYDRCEIDIVSIKKIRRRCHHGIEVEMRNNNRTVMMFLFADDSLKCDDSMGGAL